MIRGSLDRLHLGDLVQWLQMGSLSGRLTVIQKRIKRNLDFIDGRVVYVSSNHPDERLAAWFAASELADVHTLQAVLAKSLLRRNLFTSLITEEGGVSDEDLRICLTQLGERIVCRLLVAQHLDFSFDPSYPVQDLLNLSMDVDPNSLLMEAARQSDELTLENLSDYEELIPHTGKAFERFFWDLIRDGIAGDDPVDGEQIANLYQLVRDTMDTLAHWMSSSPGLIPIPETQIREIGHRLKHSSRVEMDGLPHAAWNQMVLGHAVRSPQLIAPRGLAQLEDVAAQLNLWEEMISGENWQRPDASRLDILTREEAATWSIASAAAAEVLDVDPDQSRLAAHMLTIPCDFILWILSNLPVPHTRLRLTLVRELPRRLGAELALIANFPEEMRRILAEDDESRLGICLHIGRKFLQSEQLWPDPLGNNVEKMPDMVDPDLVEKAIEAARTAISTRRE